MKTVCSSMRARGAPMQCQMPWAKVRCGLGALRDVEPLRRVEGPLVEVGEAEVEQDQLPGPYRHSVHRDVLGGIARQDRPAGLGRPQHLFHGVGHHDGVRQRRR